VCDVLVAELDDLALLGLFALGERDECLRSLAPLLVGNGDGCALASRCYRDPVGDG
jgi:hypothetical protein